MNWRTNKMPTFDFECTKCGYKEERTLIGTNYDWDYCPDCNGKMKKIIGAPIGIVKGKYTAKNCYSGKD